MTQTNPPPNLPVRFSRCVADKRNKSFSHDNLFDTLLGAFAVNTIDYSVSLDIFNSCEVSDANTEVQ